MHLESNVHTNLHYVLHPNVIVKFDQVKVNLLVNKLNQFELEIKVKKCWDCVLISLSKYNHIHIKDYLCLVMQSFINEFQKISPNIVKLNFLN